MRQQNNGRRRQNRGSNRRSFNNGNLNGFINKNTVIDSSGPDGRQRGSVSQLNEKYISLASDASSSTLPSQSLSCSSQTSAALELTVTSPSSQSPPTET